MVDFVTICNSACITCIWCLLFSICFPRFHNEARGADSSECCAFRKQREMTEKISPVENCDYVDPDCAFYKPELLTMNDRDDMRYRDDYRCTNRLENGY